MMQLLLRVGLCITALCTASVSPLRAQAPSHDTPRQPAVTAQFADRLSALGPDNPEAYFLLAEDIFDMQPNEDGKRLARHLIVLAYELDRKRQGPGPFGASCCLLLAEMTSVASERERLRALAMRIDPRRTPPAWTARRAPGVSDDIDFQVATAVGLTRSGDGAYARQIIRKPEVKDRLVQLDRIARRAGISGGTDAIVREASRWPCPVCANARVERGGGNEPRLCSNCAGTPGPDLSREDLLAQLRFEAWLLGGVRRSWSAQVTVDRGAQVVDLDPAGLPSLLGVDATRPFWRSGKWMHTPDGDRAPDATQQGAPAPDSTKPEQAATSSSSSSN